MRGVRLDTGVLWRAGLLQLAAVAALSLVLAALLPRSFFEDGGWLSGPAAWFACAAVTARLLGLPAGPVLLGALLAGLLSAFAVVLGIHWLGVLIAIAAFAAWCAWIARGGALPRPRARAGAEA